MSNPPDTAVGERAERSAAPRDERADERHHARTPGEGKRDVSLAAAMQVRAADLEPYVGLRYLAKLFRLIAILLLISLVAAVAQNIYLGGPRSLLAMIPELSQLLVLTGLLWGAGDLALLLIDVGHDVRATRILIGRQAAHHVAELRADDPRGDQTRAAGHRRET